MGSRNSILGRRMGDQDEGSSSSGRNRPRQSQVDDETGETDPDLATILAYLIRSGQVRILGSSGLQQDDSDDEDDDEWVGPARSPEPEAEPDTKAMEVSELKQELLLRAGGIPTMNDGCQPSVTQLLRKREVGMFGAQCFTKGDRCIVSSCFLPNQMRTVAKYQQKAFCGGFSEDGTVFLSACQDQYIRLYDTTKGDFREFKSIRARDVGWSIIDTAFSPDGNYMIYSSWSDCIHLCNIYGNSEIHSSLNLCPETNRFCTFSLRFSYDCDEILAGANDGHLYIYDRDRNERILRIDAHEDDVNAVAFADASSQILFSGGDDGLVKVWDRRMLSEENPNPVGVLAGHVDGITFIDSKGDARYLLSNCKDQTIKLWDMRKFSPQTAQDATRREVAKQHWDYRWQQVPRRVGRVRQIQGDSSLMTYRGHSVLHTLIRAYFSPEYSTGQRYIYSGCATGCVVVYDILTGKVVTRLRGHSACVRDVSWHPYEPVIMSTSWDCSVGEWNYRARGSHNSDSDMDDSDSDSEWDDEFPVRRRSPRLAQQRRNPLYGERHMVNINL